MFAVIFQAFLQKIVFHQCDVQAIMFWNPLAYTLDSSKSTTCASLQFRFKERCHAIADMQFCCNSSFDETLCNWFYREETYLGSLFGCTIMN